MIFKWLFKNGKYILDVVIVLGLVVLVFLWNPWNLFGKGLQLEDTANMVSEIKEIGELVTAEYYGEVIASHQEAELEILDVDSVELLGEIQYDSIKRYLYNAYIRELDDIEERIKERWSDRKERRKRARYLRRARKAIINDALGNLDRLMASNINNEDILNATILFVGQYEHGDRIKINKFVRKSDKGREGYVRRIFARILQSEFDRIIRYHAGDIAYQGYLTSGFSTHARFTDYYYKYAEEKMPGDQRKMELAVIGRGSVKAGFGFDQLDDRNVVYDENSQTLYFFGFSARILNQDINPWFIPEQRVPGFQVIAAEKLKDRGFEKMKALKLHCIKKLRLKSEEAGIIERAQANGEESLKAFFSLITGNDIRKVIFRKDPLTYNVENILADSVISVDEVNTLEAAIDRQLSAINGEQNSAIKERKQKLLQETLQRLRRYDIVIERDSAKHTFGFNYYTRHLPDILRDSMVTQAEWQVIAREIRHNYVDPSLRYQQPPADQFYWFTDSLEYISVFNDFIDQIISTPLNKEFYQNAEKDTTLLIDPHHLKYPVRPDSLWQRYIRTEKPVIWYQPVPSGPLPVSAALHKQDETLTTTFQMDEKVFTNDSSRKYRVSLSGNKLLVESKDMAKKFVPGRPLFGYTKDTTKKAKEIHALRTYLMHKNKAHHDVSAVTRLNRQMNAQGVRQKIKKWARNAQQYVKDL